MNNRDILIVGALILVGAVVLELYNNFANPYIDYLPDSFSNLLLDTPQIFNYYKDGEIIGNYTYTLTTKIGGNQTLYTLTTRTKAIYQNSSILLDTAHIFFGIIQHVEYTVDANIAGINSSINCTLHGDTVDENTTSQGKSQSTTITLQPNTVIIDNNDPAHWELLLKSFNYQAGEEYDVNVFTPQGALVQNLQFGVDASHQYVNIGSKSYECVVAREPDLEITLYLYQGNLIQFTNDADGVMIVKRIS